MPISLPLPAHAPRAGTGTGTGTDTGTGTPTGPGRRGHRPAALALLTAALLLPTAGPALADSHEPETGTDTAPAAAGGDFRSAGVIGEDRPGTATAVSGDYLYWTFPAGAGQRITVDATVTLPDPALRSGPATWQVDLYDGLRRLQPCVGGRPTAGADTSAETLELSCTLPVVRPWAESWADDPLPGAYSIRLTATDLPEEDLGLPFQAEVSVGTEAVGGSADGGGRLGAPLVLTSRAGSLDTDSADTATDPEAGSESTREEDADSAPATVPEPDGGWFGGWWTDRWAWTAAGGLLAAAAAIGGYRLIRRRPS
ncbi:hypothetical protein [Streptomyces sp. YIM 98790]|uniref:hypothetical protein n=1 Tax=Streptomyces sp. YIM 98790 TaxID=2689077 RepID=UPI001FB5C7D8|nr:hypothetical protein [Streptomyces sp. YIM 98790]